MTKPVFGVSEKVSFKPETSLKYEISLVVSLYRYDTFQYANNKGADQSAQMHRLVCVFVDSNPPTTGFLVPQPI